MVLGSTILSNFSRAYAAGPGERRPESSRGSVFCCRRDRILSRSAVFLVPARYCWRGRVGCEAPVSCIALIPSIAPATCFPSPISTDLGRVRGWADTLPFRKEHPVRRCRSLDPGPSRTRGRGSAKLGGPYRFALPRRGPVSRRCPRSFRRLGAVFEAGRGHRPPQFETRESGAGPRRAPMSSGRENQGTRLRQCAASTSHYICNKILISTP